VTLNLFLAVTPRAAARTRCVCRGRYPTVYNEPAYKDWLAQAIEQLRALAPVAPSPAAFEGDIAIDLEVVVTKPKATKKARPKGDRDNFEKGVFDAITQAGGIWKDDDQVVGGDFRKRWAEPGEREGYHLTIRFLET
jgi:Holliday junction resolvase RusA-like endonuclease